MYIDYPNLVWEIFITDPEGVRCYDGGYAYIRNVKIRLDELAKRGYTEPEIKQVLLGNHGQSMFPRVKP